MGRSLPSIEAVIASAQRAARRFPLVLLAALASASLAVVLAGQEKSPVALQACFAAATLSLPLLFAVSSLVELRAWSGATRSGSFAVAVAALALIGWGWLGWTESGRATRYGLFSAAFHLSAAFLAYVRRNEPQGFWQFNRVLFLRVLTTALYAGVLFLGLAAALGAISVLFGVHVKPQAYLQLFAVDVFLFGSWFLLAGLPESIASLDGNTSYPDGLRKFAQFVLIPLVVLYLLILTAYLGKVIITRQWPSGWIGLLVSFVTIAGMLAWLLVRPLEDRAEYAWVKPFTRGFYLILLPSIAMLWLAIGKRIAQYGLTERRTIVLAGVSWLSGIALYYIVTRSRNIKVIPMSLCVCILAISAGPVSAFSLSRRDQTARLATVLTRNGLLRDGKFVKAMRVPTDSDVIAINEAVWYLRDAHGPHVFDTFVNDSLRRRLARSDTSTTWWDVTRHAEIVVSSIGLPTHRHNSAGVVRRGGKDSVTINFTSRDLDAMPVDDFSYVAMIAAFRVVRDSVFVGDSVRVRLAADSSAIELTRAGVPLLRFSADSLAERATHSTTSAVETDSTGAPVVNVRPAMLPPPIVLDASGPDAHARLILTHLAVSQHGGHWRMQDFGGALLVRAARDNQARR
jgi:hypothetical protein